MTVRDLYIYSNDEQTFIIFKEGATKSCFIGSLEDCPTELIDRLVYQFRAIDFNTIEVILNRVIMFQVKHSNKICWPIGISGRMEKTC